MYKDIIIIIAITIIGIFSFIWIRLYNKKINKTISFNIVLKFSSKDNIHVVCDKVKELVQYKNLDGVLSFSDFLASTKNALESALISDILYDSNHYSITNEEREIISNNTDRIQFTIINNIFKRPEIIDIINDRFNELANEYIKESDKLEKETVEYNSNIGIEDPDNMDKESLGLVESNGDDMEIEVEYDSIINPELIDEYEEEKK